MVAGSGSASAILTHDGRVFTWGKSKSGLLGHPKSSENNLNIPTLVEGLNGHIVKYISCGNSNSLHLNIRSHGRNYQHRRDLDMG
jgi:alpha-tubulin suppressor-like RCC1 family protein